jgi:hypothetical protein
MRESDFFTKKKKKKFLQQEVLIVGIEGTSITDAGSGCYFAGFSRWDATCGGYQQIEYTQDRSGDLLRGTG